MTTCYLLSAFSQRVTVLMRKSRGCPLIWEKLVRSFSTSRQTESVTFSLPLYPLSPHHSWTLLPSYFCFTIYSFIDLIHSPVNPSCLISCSRFLSSIFIPKKYNPPPFFHHPFSSSHPSLCPITPSLISLFNQPFPSLIYLLQPAPSSSSSFDPSTTTLSPPHPSSSFSQDAGWHRPGDPATEERGGRRVGGEGGERGGQTCEEGQRDQEGEVGAAGKTDQTGCKDREGWWGANRHTCTVLT